MSYKCKIPYDVNSKPVIDYICAHMLSIKNFLLFAFPSTSTYMHQWQDRNNKFVSGALPTLDRLTVWSYVTCFKCNLKI